MSALLKLIRARKAELEAARQPPPELLARLARLSDDATADEILQLFSMDELCRLFTLRHEDAIDLFEEEQPKVDNFCLTEPEAAGSSDMLEAIASMPLERSQVAASLETPNEASGPLSSLTRSEQRRARRRYGWNLSRQ